MGKKKYKITYSQADVIAWEDRIRGICDEFAQFRQRMSSVGVDEVSLKIGTFWHRIEQAEKELEKVKGEFAAQIVSLERRKIRSST